MANQNPASIGAICLVVGLLAGGGAVTLLRPQPDAKPETKTDAKTDTAKPPMTPPSTVKDPEPQPKPKSPMTREQFSSLAMGKTMDEVLKAVGPPDSAKESDGRPLWWYRKRTVDPKTNAIDDWIQVYFSSGKVDRILFE